MLRSSGDAANTDVAASGRGNHANTITLNGLGINVTAASLGAVVRAYKAAVTLRINNLRHTPGASVWQRGYWEKIIREEQYLARVRRYIIENPARHAARREELARLLGRMNRRE